MDSYFIKTTFEYILTTIARLIMLSHCFFGFINLTFYTLYGKFFITIEVNKL